MKIEFVRLMCNLIDNTHSSLEIIIDNEMYFNSLGLLHFIFHGVNLFLSPVILFQRSKRVEVTILHHKNPGE